MTQAAHDTMTLAGLAAANGPWLAVRLHRLAEHAGLPLAQDVVEYAVVNTSRVLEETLNAEGRPSPHADEATDPVAALGREQAQANKQAGLSMPASLKVQRLLRRAYDDLVRESWVEKDSRGRAHEDVERFFERALIGLVASWTGQTGSIPPPPALQVDESQAKLLARREDELRRAMEAAQKLTLALRQSRDRIDAVTAELARAQEQGQGLEELKAQLAQAQAQLQEQGNLKEQLAQIEEQAAQNLSGLKEQLVQLKEQAAKSLSNLKAEFAQAHKQALAQAQAQVLAQAQTEQHGLSTRIGELEEERSALGRRLAELEMALAAHGDAETARLEAQEELDRARAEADRAREKAEQARSELQQLKEAAQDLRNNAERQSQGAMAEAETLRAELHQLREAHSNLSSEAEAMRARLAETGSRMAEMRRAEEKEIQARLAQAADVMAQAQARIAEVEQEREALTARLKDAETQIIQLSQDLERSRADVAAAQATEAQLREHSNAQSQSMDAERFDLAQRLKDAEAQVIELSEDLQRARAELGNAQVNGSEASAQAQNLEAERFDLAKRLKDAEAQVIGLSEDLQRSKTELTNAQAVEAQLREQASAQAQNLEAERFDLAKRLKDAEAQVIGLSEDLAQSRADCARAQDAEDRLQGASAQALSLEAERFDLAKRLKEAEAQVIRLSEDLTLATQAQSSSEAQRLEAERRAGELLQEAKTQAKIRLDEMAFARETSARLLSTHLTLTPDGVAALDAAGTFTAWNKPLLALFGLSDAMLAAGAEAVLSHMAAGLQRPEQFLAHTQELLGNPLLTEEGMALTTHGGDSLILRSAGVRSANRTVGRLFNFRDVSLEHDMENLVREIESITRYELGQALTAFIHLPQALLDDPATTPAQAQKLTTIRDSGYHIVNTVNMAVDIFRMERGLYQMRAGCSLDLAVVVRRAVKDVTQLAASRHVDLELLLNQSPLPQDCKLNAPGDPILAHALTVNLLRDSLEAAPSKSSVHAVLQQNEAGLSVSITRQGALAEDKIAAYFDKPTRQDAHYGLQRARYAAQLIAKSLGGTLTLSSAPESGTSLSLHLPKK